MVTIQYGFKESGEGHMHKEISIGYGLPTHGQDYFVTKATIWTNCEGITVYATLDLKLWKGDS